MIRSYRDEFAMSQTHVLMVEKLGSRLSLSSSYSREAER